jgi:hypothetical protein
MKEKLFFVLDGNNGASYIINCKSWNTITNSLQFYKARTFKAKFLKFGLQIVLLFKGKLKSKRLKTRASVEAYLQEVVKSNCSFGIDSNCSVLISPTRDKVIVNNHGEYFQKFAFGKSYKNVKKEGEIYRLFKQPIKSFFVSEIFDEYHEAAQFCTFKLRNNHNAHPSPADIDMVSVLLEFFQVSSTKECTVGEYVNSLHSSLSDLDQERFIPQLNRLKLINEEYGHLKFPLGLVHRDFKPWNVIENGGLLIFDFEEALTDGPPLEDLLNYDIDPIIRYEKSAAVASKLFSTDRIECYQRYLGELNIKVDYTIFINMYLIERAAFWARAKEYSTSEKFLALFSTIN